MDFEQAQRHSLRLCPSRYSLEQQFSTWVGNVQRYAWLSHLGRGVTATGIWWVEAGDVAISPVMHKTAFPSEELPNPTSPVLLQKPCFLDKSQFLQGPQRHQPIVNILVLILLHSAQEKLRAHCLISHSIFPLSAMLPTLGYLHVSSCFRGKWLFIARARSVSKSQKPNYQVLHAIPEQQPRCGILQR